jgi:hypothetical protein
MLAAARLLVADEQFCAELLGSALRYPHGSLCALQPSSSCIYSIYHWRVTLIFLAVPPNHHRAPLFFPRQMLCGEPVNLC